MRTGLLEADRPSASWEDTLGTVAALMRLFVKHALETAAKYAHAKGRRVVTADDMKRSLKYEARTFLQQEALEELVEQERVVMEEEEEDEEEGEEGGEGEEQEEEVYEGTSPVSPASPNSCRLVKHVDEIVAKWHLWEPEAPVHALVKRAIDGTEEGLGS